MSRGRGWQPPRDPLAPLHVPEESERTWPTQAFLPSAWILYWDTVPVGPYFSRAAAENDAMRWERANGIPGEVEVLELRPPPGNPT